jgi:hypothetical protein
VSQKNHQWVAIVAVGTSATKMNQAEEEKLRWYDENRVDEWVQIIVI